jgi:hypothetical protein
MILWCAHVKHVVGELEHGADDLFESLSTEFSQDLAA